MAFKKREELFPHNKFIGDYTTSELKSLVGNFEKEYNEHATGELVNNPILGPVKQGTVEHAIRVGAISHETINGVLEYRVRLPGYHSYQFKLNALRLLILRRGKARKYDQESKKTLVKSF